MDYQAIADAYIAKTLRTVPKGSAFDHTAAITAWRALLTKACQPQAPNIFIGTWPECIDEAWRIQHLTGGAANLDVAVQGGPALAKLAAMARAQVLNGSRPDLAEHADILDAVLDSSGPALVFDVACFISYPPTAIVNNTQIWSKLQGASGWVEGSAEAAIEAASRKEQP